MKLYDLMMDPSQVPMVNDDDTATVAGQALQRELIECTSSTEGDFGALYTQMDTYEKFWRCDVERTAWGKDHDLTKNLPPYAINDGRVLADRLVRSVTRQPIRYRVKLGSGWSPEQQEMSQELEYYCAAAHYAADCERRAQHPRPFGTLQHDTAAYLIVRGVAIVIPFMRSSPRQKVADIGWGTGEEPIVVRTPDPRECMWADGFFAHKHTRRANEFAGKPWAHVLKYGQDNECEAYNVWWRDADQNVWNASFVGKDSYCWIVPPTNHTSTRGMKVLPVIIDTAFGSPSEMRVAQSRTTSIQHQYQGALETNVQAYRAKNLIKAYKMVQLRDGTFYSMAIFSDKQLTDDEKENVYNGRNFFQFNKDDRPPAMLAPPELADGIRLFMQELDQEAAMGGLPTNVGTGVPEGMSGIAAQEMFLQGDAKAGPIAGAQRRIFKDMQYSIRRQHARLGRMVKMRGEGAFSRTFKASDVAQWDEFDLEVQHEPFLVEDEYRKAQTASTWRQAGRPFIAVMDDVTDDPIREDTMRQEEQMRALPALQYLDQARIALRNKRPDQAALLMKMAAIEAGMLDQAAAQNGITNAPASGPTNGAGVVPQLPEGTAPPPMVTEQMDPTQLADQQRLGLQGQSGGY